MKKIRAWIILVICSIFMLMLLFIAVIVAYQYITGESTDSFSMDAKGGFSLLVFAIMTIIGIIYSIKTLRKRTIRLKIPFDEPFHFSVSGTVDFTGYRKMILKNSFKIQYLFPIIGFLLIVIYAIFDEQYRSQIMSTLYAPLVGFLGLMPLFIIIQLQKTKKTNRIFNENILYTFNNTSVQMKGETIDSTLKWEHFVKITETNYFFLLYQNKTVATIIDKKLFRESHLLTLSAHIRSLPAFTE